MPVTARANLSVTGYRQHLGQGLLGQYDLPREACPDSLRTDHCRIAAGSPQAGGTMALVYLCAPECSGGMREHSLKMQWQHICMLLPWHGWNLQAMPCHAMSMLALRSLRLDDDCTLRVSLPPCRRLLSGVRACPAV